MQVNWKKKSEKSIIAGRVAGAARLGIGIGCLTICCMMCLMICLMVGAAGAAEPGKIKVNLDFTKINKALEEASTPSSNRSSGPSSYTVAPSPRMSSTTGGSASTARTGKTKVKLDFTKINKALGEASTLSSNRSTTRSTTTPNTMGGMTGTGMADAMAGSMASSMAGSMAPAMTGATPSTSSKSTSKNTSGNTTSSNIMEGIQMDSEMTKIISETRNEMMKSIMQGMFSNTSMMANMQKRVMSDNMPKSSSQGGSSPSVMGPMNSSGK